MGFGLGCLALLFTTVVRDSTTELGRFHNLGFITLLISVAGYLTESLFPAELNWIPFSLLILTPAAFCLLCHTYFADRPGLPLPWALLAVYSFLPPILVTLFSDARSEGGLGMVAWYLPQIAEILLVLKGLTIIVSNWQDDLVEARRRFRKDLILIIGLAALFVVLFDNLIHSPRWIPHGLVVVCIWIITYRLMTFRDSGVDVPPSKTLAAPSNSSGIVEQAKSSLAAEAVSNVPLYPSQENFELVQAERKLAALMSDGFYRKEKLTISQLGEALQLSEYKVRKLINSNLGYRNFNDYINELRVNEAAKRLVLEPDTPILNISLDVGYRSLTSFNRAFRDKNNLTPTEYRQRNVLIEACL